jgi:hypothetical protein
MRNITTNVVAINFINDCFIRSMDMVRNVVATIRTWGLRFLGSFLSSSESGSKCAKRRAAALRYRAHWHLPSAGGYRLTALAASVCLEQGGQGCSQRPTTSLRNSVS